MYNYLQNIINSNFCEYEFLAQNLGYSKILEISFSGWKRIEFVVDNEPLNELLLLAGKNAKIIFEMYGDEYDFFQPSFCFNSKTDNASIKFPMRKKENPNSKM